MSNTITIETTCWCGKKSDGHMSNLPPDTTQGMVDRAAYQKCIPDDDEDSCPSCGCRSEMRDQHYATCAYLGLSDEDLMGRYEPGCEVSAVINVGPLDVAAMRAALDRLKATLTDDERAAIKQVFTVQPK